MKVAVALNERNIKAVVPETIEEAKGLLVVETDTMEAADFITQNWADAMDRQACEAVLCGDMYDAGLFNEIAAKSITRYNAKGLVAYDAVKAMLDYQLDCITDYIGGVGCSGHDHMDKCMGDCG